LSLSFVILTELHARAVSL